MIDKENSSTDGTDKFEPILESIEPSSETASNGMQNNNNIGDNKQPVTQRTLIDRIKISDRWMIFLTAALVFASIVSAVIFYFQWRTMRNQLDEMKSTGKQADELIKANTALADSARKQAEAANVSAKAASESNKLNRELFEASQRPWIKADVTIAAPITFETDGMHLALKFDLRNTGHTPAMYAWPEWRIYSSRLLSPSALIKKQSELCSELIRPNGQNTPGLTIFPGEEKSITIITTLPQSDIAADMAPFQDVKIAREHPAISPVVLGCVDYQLPSRQEHHQTGFAFEIWDTGTSEMALSGPLVLVSKEPIPINRLHLQPMLIQGLTFFSN